MIIIIGKMALWVAFLLSIMQISFCYANYRKQVALLLVTSLSVAFGMLIYAHISDDFSLVNVFEHSHTVKPLLYKVTGVWGNHEGSILLLVWIMGLYHLWLSFWQNSYERTIQLHALMLVSFLSFLMFTSDPFAAMDVPAKQGLDLNPLLQDIGLAIHPPLLYVGYIGFSVLFCQAISGLAEKNISSLWAKQLLPVLLFMWVFLTAGIGLGSWWAYRELGWGGFWFWDPVENVSLMPWLAGTALLHSLMVGARMQRHLGLSVILALLCFILSIIGIFLVRSGVLTSVHAFAQDPERGLAILGFLSLVILGSVAVYSYYAEDALPRFSKIANSSSKELAILLNNVLLVSFCLTILLGTLYPLILQITAGKFITVAAPYFNQILRYGAVPLLVLAIFAPAFSWKAQSLPGRIARYFPSLLFTILGSWWLEMTYPIAILGLALMMVSFQQLIMAGKRFKYMLGMSLAHGGIGLLALSITMFSYQTKEIQKMLRYDESVTIDQYQVTLKGMALTAQENYLLRQGTFLVSKENKEVASLVPEVRFYPVRQQNTTESAIYRDGLSDIYIVMGEVIGQDQFGVRIYYRPMINGIWLAVILMVLGGFFACINRPRKLDL